MSNGTEFLQSVTEKLKVRRQETEKTIQNAEADIAEMNDYYWENYTEMDEYGYENYDNQQALKAQVSAKQEQKQYLRRLLKMEDSPFFGSVAFRYEDEDEPETFYIGIGNFSEQRGSLPLIYDWRAPVSGLFYDYDKGPGFYEAPGGTMYGDITGKWQYKIRKGKMVYEFESDVKIDDEILKQELGKNGDIKLKNIVRTIQKEQNAIIRNTKDKILVIQGAAGSGKTSIALHRIAYLLYHDRQKLRSSNVLILSPNSVFSDYISHILPELGEENIREMSLDLFAYRELQDIAADCEDRYNLLEQQMEHEHILEELTENWKRKAHEEGAENWKLKKKQAQFYKARKRYLYKQSKAFLQDMEGFLIELEDRLVDLEDFHYKNYEKTEAELRDLFYNRFPAAALMSRMDNVREYVLDEYETLFGDLPEEEQENLKVRFDNMYVTKDLYKIYNWFLKEKNFPQLPQHAYENRVIPYEDVYPMLYLKYRLQDRNPHKNVRHLVIDEMQDYSYLQYTILQKLFPCSKTILGDRAQTLDSELQDVLTFLPNITGKETRTILLNKSYRNTREISDYADRICPVTGIEYIDRHGKPVEEYQVENKEQMLTHILRNLNLTDTGYETAAILTMTENEATEIADTLKEKGIQADLLTKDSSTFKKGLTITTWYLAKGLEFDQVFATPGHSHGNLYNQYLYICATRALHELYVYKTI